MAEATLSPAPLIVSDEEAARIVAEIGIPPCPAILTAMLREARQEEADFAVIARLIASDMGLSAALLKTVNSPFYGLASKIGSVHQALAFLGLRNVVRLVTGLLLQQAFPVSNHEGVQRLWESSAAVAAGTARLARELRCADRDEAYTYGLFRDCGMLLMVRKYPEYADFIRAGGFPHADGFAIVETRRYAASHAQVGFHMASSWYAAEDLCQAVRRHHDREFVATETAGADHRARVLVALGMVVDAVQRTTRGAALDAGPALACLRLDPAQAAALVPAVLEAFSESQEVAT